MDPWIRIWIYTKMSWIRKDHTMKNEDKDDFFLIEANKNEFIRTSTSEGTKKNELFVPKLSRNEDKPKYLFLNHPRNKEKLMHSFHNYQRDEENEFICS
jgi:hypothetical protein